MITIPLLIIALPYLALLVWAIRGPKTLLVRTAALLVLLSPVIYLVGSYQFVHYRHYQDCAREGGLKVFVQPEKADRIRLNLDSFIAGSRAEFLLTTLYPSLKTVEGWDGNFDGQGHRSGYFSYTLDQSTTSFSKKDWKVVKTQITELDSAVYELSVKHENIDSITKDVYILRRGDQRIASWTSFTHYWWENGFSNIAWQCFCGSNAGRGWELSLAELIVK